MGLDYSQGCVNYRDVGECINLLADSNILPVRRIFRGGKLDFVEFPAQIGYPGTILNLRKGTDLEDRRFGADYWHFPISNNHEKYNTFDPIVRQWLNDIFTCLMVKVERFPVLFHCTSGKDRTGVVIASLLSILKLDRELIIQEYLWSDGDVKRTWIEETLDGIVNIESYFRKVKLQVIRNKILDVDGKFKIKA